VVSDPSSNMNFLQTTGFNEECNAVIAMVRKCIETSEKAKALWEPVSTALHSVHVRANTLADPKDESTNHMHRKSFCVPEDFDTGKVASAILSVTVGIKALAKEMRSWSGDCYSINDVCDVLDLVDGFDDELKYAFRDHPGLFDTVKNWLGL